MAIDLTLAECISLNSKLESADGKDDELTLTEIMTSLKAADPRNKMQNISKSKLGKTVMRLSRRNEPAVKKLAEQLLEQWKAQIKKPGSTTPAKTPAPVAATKPAGGSGDAVKSEQQPAAVASPANAATAPAVEAAPAAEATCKSEGRGRLEVNEAVKIESLAPSGSSSMTSPRPPPGKLLPTGDAVRDSVCEKLKEVFDKGIKDNAKLLRELDADPASMAQECEAAMFKESNEFKDKDKNLYAVSIVEVFKHVTTGLPLYPGLHLKKTTSPWSLDVKFSSCFTVMISCHLLLTFFVMKSSRDPQPRYSHRSASPSFHVLSVVG